MGQAHSTELLVAAAAKPSLAEVKRLVEKGANVNRKNKARSTALLEATLTGNLEIVKYLVGHGANIKIADLFGRTAIHNATYSGNLDVVCYLVEKGADIEEKTRSGLTPIHFAARHSHVDIVSYLIHKGADVTAMTRNGWTALPFAKDKGHDDEVIELLETALKKHEKLEQQMHAPRIRVVKHPTESEVPACESSTLPTRVECLERKLNIDSSDSISVGLARCEQEYGKKGSGTVKDRILFLEKEPKSFAQGALPGTATTPVDPDPKDFASDFVCKEHTKAEGGQSLGGEQGQEVVSA